MNIYAKEKHDTSKYRSMLATAEEYLRVHDAIHIAVTSLKQSVHDYIAQYKKYPSDMSCVVDVSGRYTAISCYEWFKLEPLARSCRYDGIKIEMISESKARIEFTAHAYAPIYERKKIFIINGVPKSGKDTLIGLSSKELQFNVANTSTIDMVKDLASTYDLWDGVAKTDAARNMLSELKGVITKYSDSINNYICKQVELFLEDNTTGAMFIHCGEPEEIDKLKDMIMNRFMFRALTLVVRRDEAEDVRYGNDSDTKVLQYDYDIAFINNNPLEESAKEFGHMIDALTLTSKSEYEKIRTVTEYGRYIQAATNEEYAIPKYEFHSDEARALMYVSVRQLREGIDVAIKEFAKIDEADLLLSSIDGVIDRYKEDLKKSIKTDAD